MKTPDEIKKGLQEAPHVKYFDDDPSSADGRDVRYGVVIGYVLREEIVALIERLAQAEEALAFERAYREDQAVSWELKCSLLEREAAQAKRERDAAVEDLSLALDGVDQMNNDCCFCKHKDKPVCETCDWEWRGVCEEDTSDENA